MGFLHYIQVEADWVDSREAIDMSDELGISTDEVLGKVTRFWCWARVNAAPRGRIGGRNPIRAVEEAVRWTGKSGAWVKAAITAGILRWDGEELEVRGWEKRYGAPLAKAAKDAERKRKARASDGPALGRRSDVQRTSTRRKRVDQDLDQDQDLPPDQDLRLDQESSTHHPQPPKSPVVVAEDVDRLWKAFQAQRRSKGLPEEISRKRFDAWAVHAKLEGIPDLVLLGAYGLFLSDDHFREKAWATNVFCSEGVWRDRAAQVSARAQDEPEKPKTCRHWDGGDGTCGKPATKSIGDSFPVCDEHHATMLEEFARDNGSVWR